MENNENTNNSSEDKVITLSGMYKDYFLDYSSYVILERAVPTVQDGLKPVQRRILHAMKTTDDGRFHKVANIIGNTMQYHPHGDMAIGDALVNLGQKGLLIDCQGNWGDPRTGDSAAASRYIEARLTKFALEVAFNAQTTEWQTSYDGRKNEPVNLPMKFPLLLAQGVEGIAVGLSTKIMPHNFIELINASINILKEKSFTIYPDFLTGGSIDVSDYNKGKRGGKIKVRASIEIEDKKTLKITELPYGVTTQQLIDSIIKANDKGKIKIKKVIDNTAEFVEILVELHTGVSPQLTMDALFAFTNCETSVSPNACVVDNDKPYFLDVHDILERSTFNTKELLRRELEIKKSALLEKWLFASLEKIFIEKRVYHKIEECETWEEVLEVIEKEMAKYVVAPDKHKGAKDDRIKLTRTLTTDDYTRLTEIRIKRISKFNTFKANELIVGLLEELKEVNHHLEFLTEFAISYFENLLKKYGKDKERKTKITSFETISATQVVANNTKLYVNKKDGFFGFGLKKDEFVKDCSDIDDIIIFKKEGAFQVSKINEKVFVGKGILHIDVWKKGDDRMTYNMIYLDGLSGRTMAKRFNITSITRDRVYPLTKGTKGSRLEYFTVNPNGEGEIVTIQLTQGCSAKKKIFDYNFGELAIKGRGSQGNLVTKYPVKKITLKEVGKSTLGAIKLWMDEVSGRFNTEERGIYLGDYDTGDKTLAIYKSGEYEIIEFDLGIKRDPLELIHIAKWDPKVPISAIYYDGDKKCTFVKRFLIETSSTNQKFSFISDNSYSKLLFASIHPNPQVEYNLKVNRKTMEGELNLVEFIDIKGWKAMGNKLSGQKLFGVKDVSVAISIPDESEKDSNTENPKDENGQKNLF